MDMPGNGIPGVKVLGPGEENLRFLIGLGVYAVALVALIIYLVYKLPRDEDNVPQDSADEDEEI
jgi:hypothetical protein